MSFPTEQLLLKLLHTIEKSIFPLTSSKETDSLAAKIFGAAVLSTSHLRLITAAGNKDEASPIHHGEIVCIHEFFAQRSSNQGPQPGPQDCILLSSHEPCCMCLSAIAWSGFKKVYYLFSYEETRDTFGVPEDIEIVGELFGTTAFPSNTTTSVKSLYKHDNNYFKSRSLMDLADEADGEARENLIAELDRVKGLYIALKGPV